MENMKKMLLIAIVALVMGQAVVAHDGCNAPVATPVETETAQAPVDTPAEQPVVPAVEEDTEETGSDEEDSEVENLLNQMETPDKK